MLTTMSEPSLYVLSGIVLAFSAMAAVRVGMAIYGHIKFEIAYRKLPRVIERDEEKSCKEPHKWQSVILAVRDLAPGKYTICLECGSISGNHEYMVSPAVLEQAKEALMKADQKLAAERELQERVMALVDQKVTAFIHLNFPRESNDPTVVNKLLELSECALRAQDDAIEKVATELEVQEMTDQKTASWSSDIKGNA